MDSSSTFRAALTCYENKQYKKGLKLCDQLIKDNEHLGEALSLKGIIIMNLGKPTEGLELAKSGCKNNIKSGFSWHILGLIYKSMNNYEEAAKSFRSSLRNDKENITVLKDLANCTLQIQDLASNIELRKQIVYHRPSSYSHWLALWSACILGDKEFLKRLSNPVESLFDISNDSLFSEFKSSLPTRCDADKSLYISSKAAKEHSDIGTRLFRLYKNGDYLEACGLAAENIAELDRFGQCINVKMLLRLGRLEEAENHPSKTSETTDPVKELQYLWIYIERARYFLRTKKHVKAASECSELLAFMSAFEHDLFDFHTYSLRKLTLLAYAERLFRVCCLSYILSHQSMFDVNSLSLSSSETFGKLLQYSALILCHETADPSLIKLIFEFALTSKRKSLAMKSFVRLCRDYSGESLWISDAAKRFSKIFGQELLVPQFDTAIKSTITGPVSFARSLKQLEELVICLHSSFEAEVKQFPLHEANFRQCFSA